MNEDLIKKVQAGTHCIEHTGNFENLEKVVTACFPNDDWELPDSYKYYFKYPDSDMVFFENSMPDGLSHIPLDDFFKPGVETLQDDFDNDLSVEILARFNIVSGKNGRLTKLRKTDFIDGALWAKNRKVATPKKDDFFREEEKHDEFGWAKKIGISVFKEEGTIVCPCCGGDGKETCTNPDHGFIDMVGGEVGRLGCPGCGHDENHKVKNGGKCEVCDGNGVISQSQFDVFADEYGYDNEPVPSKPATPSTNQSGEAV